jgi:hypothetical protein
MGQPVIITGMHRSGTSFVAELFRLAGVHIGDRLFPPDAGNPRGYFEDDDFLALQREMVAAACPVDAIGWPDWGWTTQGTLNEDVWARFEPAMHALAESRQHHALWGWKDPRTTLLLKLWMHLLPNACAVLVVREPWRVAASVHRSPADIFTSDPSVGVRVWMFYNQRLLDLVRIHPQRSVVLPTSWISDAPTATMERVASHLGLVGLEHNAALYAEVVRSAVQRAGSKRDHEEEAFADRCPDAYALYQGLMDIARRTSLAS